MLEKKEEDKKKKTGYLEEKPGHKSSTRIMSIIALAFILCFNVIYIFLADKQLEWYFVAFNGLYLVAAFVPKYLAKIIEIKQ